MRIRNVEFVKRYDKRERERGGGIFLDHGIHVGKKNGDGRLWEKCMWAEQMALQHRQIENAY